MLLDVPENFGLRMLNNKEIPIGSVAYYLENSKIHQGKKEIKFGIVKEHYADTIALQLIEPRDTRRINGIPIKQFKTPTRWQKLPKGWTYDTKLFEVTWDSFPEVASCRIDNSERILQLYNDGHFVNVEDNDHAHIDSEIDSKNGWRIVRRYPSNEYHPSYMSVNYLNVFTTYAAAKESADNVYAEFLRQAELSDYDWAVEQIDHELDRWAKLCSITDNEKEKYRSWILNLPNVERIEVRISMGEIQWKYLSNKRWMNMAI